MSVESIATRFKTPGNVLSIEALGSGNINDTYQVKLDNGHSFVLQKINQAVFPNPRAVMHNIQIVTDFAQRKIAKETIADRVWQVPQVIESRDGKCYINDQGKFWRALTMIANTSSYEKVETPEVAFEAGKVLGHFQRIISDCPINQLKDTLVGFHITTQYLEKYDQLITDDDVQKRLTNSAVAQQIASFIDQFREKASVLEEAKERGELTLRPIHGDPKITNILFDRKTGKGISIIDLDTVKPGLVHYDFGDAVRSSCNPAGEETTDLTTVAFDIKLFAELCSGYMSEAKSFITERDHAYLHDSIKIITFELGLRFFTDYLGGDTYFKTNYEGHNLNRAAVQFTLLKSIMSYEQEIDRILVKC